MRNIVMHTGHAYVRYRPGNYYYETAYVCVQKCIFIILETCALHMAIKDLSCVRIFFLPLWLRVLRSARVKNFLFTLKKHDWKILVFLFSGFSSSVGYCMFTASGVLLHSDLLFYTLQFQNCHHTKITNCLITLHLAKKINCHHDSMIDKIANV